MKLSVITWIRPSEAFLFKYNPFLSAASAETLNILTSCYLGVIPNLWRVLITLLLLTSKANDNCNVEKVFAATLVAISFINSATKLYFNFGEIWKSKKERGLLEFSFKFVSFFKEKYVETMCFFFAVSALINFAILIIISSSRSCIYNRYNFEILGRLFLMNASSC